MGKNKKKKEKETPKVKVTRNKEKRVTDKNTQVLQDTKNCSIKVVNNQLPWEREVLSEHSIITFEIKGGKSFVIKYDERNKCLDLRCENSPCNIQPISMNQFMIK